MPLLESLIPLRHLVENKMYDSFQDKESGINHLDVSLGSLEQCAIDVFLTGKKKKDTCTVSDRQQTMKGLHRQ